MNEIKEINNSAFSALFPRANSIFNSVAFTELNRFKAEKVKYLKFNIGDKTKIGLICGVKNSWVLSPFSAPFCGWSYNEDLKIEDIDSALILFDKWNTSEKIAGVRITFPPLFYDEVNYPLLFNAMIRNGYVMKFADVNFQYYLSGFTEDYSEKIKRNARKNLHIAIRSGLRFEKVEDEKSIELVYNIISINRSQRGFPLKMSLSDVLETIKVVKADFFSVYTQNAEVIASAIVFKVTEKIVQVIYWGHNVAYGSLKPINFLSYKLFEYYKEEKVEVVDIGPSTDAGVPNSGLVEFKQSIGCSLSLKFTMEKTYADERH